MRILDVNNVELESPDYELGTVKVDRLFIQHHEAVEAVAEAGHFEVIAAYPNGGKDVKWIIDVAAVEAADAWDEYEDIYRYIPYTAEELAERQRLAEEAYRNSPEYRIQELEAALELLLSGVTE